MLLLERFFDRVFQAVFRTRLTELATSDSHDDLTLQTMIDASPIPIIKIRFDRIVEIWNPAAEKLFGYTAAEVLGKPYPLVPPELTEEFDRIFQQMTSPKFEQPTITRRKAKDGRMIDVCLWNTPLRTTGPFNQRSAMAMMIDITGQKELEEKLKNAKADAEHASEEKTKFLSHLSHEMRTPLTSILGFSELLETCELSEQQRRSYTGAITRNCKALASLIDDFLDLSKVEAGEMRIATEPTRVREIIQDLRAILEIKAEHKGIALDIQVTDRVPEKVICDPLRLRQILINITGNAVKFTNEGRVTVVTDYKWNALFITVTDTGAGISKDACESLFKPFSQADSKVARYFGGSGLGLSLSRELANLMGGDVVLVHSELGKGSTFEIRLPAEPVDKPHLREASKDRLSVPAYISGSAPRETRV